MPYLPDDLHDRYFTLKNYGGYILLFWEEHARGSTEGKVKIWCLEIMIERRNEHEVYGKVEWCHVVHTFPDSVSLKYYLVTTV
ncbi:unnamed protein product [Arabidopsis halleri]